MCGMRGEHLYNVLRVCVSILESGVNDYGSMDDGSIDLLVIMIMLQASARSKVSKLGETDA